MSTSQSTTPRDRSILYRRTSDDKQSGNASQLTNTRQLARQYDLDIVAEIEDDGESGDDLERAGLGLVLAELERAQKHGKPVSWLVVDQSDRLSRADSLETSELLLKMRRLGVRKVATPSRAYDLFDAMDRTLLQIEADHKNNPYLKDLGRRALGGMLDAARQGFWTGQKPPLGYCVVRTPGDHPAGKKRRSGKLALDPETAPLVREMFERYLDGESTRTLAFWLSGRLGRRFSHRGVSKALRHELYAGTRVFGGRTAGRHARLLDGSPVVLSEEEKDRKGDVVRLSFPELALVTPETFAAVQRRLAGGKRRSQKKGNPISALSNLCRCGLCGGPMYSARTNSGHYLRCAGKEDGSGCQAHYPRHDETLQRMRATLAERLLDGDAVARLVELAGKQEDEARATWQASLEATERAIAGCDARLATARRRLASAADDLVEDYQQVIRELKNERAALDAELVRLRCEEPLAEEGDTEMLRNWLATARGAVEAGQEGEQDPATLNAVLRELLAEVRVFSPEPYIKGGPTVRRVEVVLPDWLSRLLGSMARRGTQHATPIVLVWEGEKKVAVLAD